MADDIHVPEIGDDIVTPAPVVGTMSHLKPIPAQAKHMEPLDFPGERVENWQQAGIEKFGDLLSKYRSLQVFMDICVKCGSCTDKCHYYLGTQDPNNMPVQRAELMREVYRRYFTPGGKLFPSLVKASDFNEETLEKWFTYFHQCSQCRRCSVFCPYGIDTAEVTMAARELMDSIGVGHKYSAEIVGKVHDLGNNLGIPKPALKGTLDFLEDDILETTGHEVRLPLDQKGAEVLLVPPSADFFSAPHVDSLMGYAKVFHQAGISYTISSVASEAANFGMFIGNFDQMQKIAKRISDQARELGVKRIVVGECGHAWRVAYAFWNTLNGPFDYLDPRYPVPQHICEFTNDLYNRGALTMDRSANDDKIITFHDSCNVARASRMGPNPGGQFEIPRALIRASANRFVDMDPDTIHEKTFCCGGGGGLLTDELMDLRIKGVMPRVTALKKVMEEDNVNFLALICAICKAQFTKVLPYYGIPMDTVGGVHQLVSNAIQLGAKKGIV
ncbi:Fe-S oxidoreductase [Magnetococcus marinus MC-1]|uniref:Fe-S oxidoreductase n=1 Tax=Magnetococcus marinus (strain ATCC BAA-1437 / JCM 17883 / MC-1) TaxID=156889 RepID=A0L3N6_MAGMM|nr:(Fe-S)-binding protein [Magnetococcus marinus]ABK42579.1 Fe-S oxidoreductase [Magnetococcus marinus MC-1]